MKTVWQLRKGGNFVQHNSTSMTFKSEAQGPSSVEFVSLETLQTTKRKHIRSALSPKEKYRWGSPTSTMVGWHAEANQGLGQSQRLPTHGLRESVGTKRHNEWTATNTFSTMR
eukprot:CAMPEP_0172765672 /NCGR_PEP_ID=MMETSP1074-20121228/179727_1 /TAXON_ID=2916 /ORGANISM="Ceratium fusus, Strain PA161109" /LENGTH=112 /DNA_ID=CAMNT_0013600657 /DNA_START=12 /DNA_END=347 /DNA_ORIENTATION=+